MEGIVSILDAEHEQRVLDLWAELKDALGLTGVYITPHAHFSYQIAARYDRAALTPLLHAAAAAHAPFLVRTAGLGIFTGASPVLYIAVVRDPGLAGFQRGLWHDLAPGATGLSPLYQPAAWMPHITIGFGDLTPETLAAAVRRLADRDFAWEIAVDNLGLIYEDATQGQVLERVPFGLPPDAAV